MSGKNEKVIMPYLSSCDSIEERQRVKAEERRRERECEEAEEEEKKRQASEAAAERRREILEGAKKTLGSSDAILEQTEKIQEESKEWMKANDQVADKLNEFKEKADAALIGNLRSFCPTLPGDYLSIQDSTIIDQLQQVYGVPQELSESEIVEKISSCESICVLVGVDTSDATAMNYAEASKPTSFQSTPRVFWSKQYQWKQQLLACAPNGVNNAVADLVDFFNSTNRRGFVITQSLDGFDRALSRGGEVFEICGNLDFMRCSKDCNTDLYPNTLVSAPELNNLPTCPQCGALCRPHILMSTEVCTEEYYQSKSAEVRYEDADVVVIIGTQSENRFAKTLALQAQKRKKLVLEFNTDPQLMYGKVMVNRKPLLENFPRMVEMIKNHN